MHPIQTPDPDIFSKARGLLKRALAQACLQNWYQSVTFLASHGEICPPHIGDPHGDPQTSPRQARSTWISCMVFFKKASSSCGSACCGLVCGSPCGSPICGGQISPWPARKVAEPSTFFLKYFLGVLVALCKGKGAPLVGYLCTT